MRQRTLTMYLKIISLLLLSAATSAAAETTDVLAACPQEPDVIGYYYNNGRYCVRDKQTWNRTATTPTCPAKYELQGAWCRRRFHHKQKPICQKDYQLFRRSSGSSSNNNDHPECQSPCPANTKAYNGLCVQPRQTLSPSFMTCPTDSEHSHRVGAHCCSKRVIVRARSAISMRRVASISTPPRGCANDKW